MTESFLADRLNVMPVNCNMSAMAEDDDVIQKPFLRDGYVLFFSFRGSVAHFCDQLCSLRTVLFIFFDFSWVESFLFKLISSRTGALVDKIVPKIPNIFSTL